MTIGERLLKYRRANGLSQEEVAERLDVTRQTISKWETDQSTPDLDKLVPLCELFKITADELLTGKTNETCSLNETQVPATAKASNAIVLSISIFLYFVSISWCIFGEEVLQLEDGILASVFMLLLAIPTCLLVYYFVSHRKEQKEEACYKKPSTEKSAPAKRALISIVALLTSCLYIGISFWTGAWNVTWILWLIFAAIVRLIDLLFELRSDQDE